MKMKYVNVFLFVLILIDTSITQKVNSCLITDSDTFTNDPIRDNGRLDKRFAFSGSLAVRNVSGSGAVYIDVTIDDETKELVFQTNHNFTHFDEDHYKRDSAITLTVKTELLCDNSTTNFTLVQNVEDANNHQPLFLEDVFRYETPSVLALGSTLSSFGDYVIAEDIDFSNNNIGFVIYPSDVFLLTTLKSIWRLLQSPIQQFLKKLLFSPYTQLMTKSHIYTLPPFWLLRLPH